MAHLKRHDCLKTKLSFFLVASLLLTASSGTAAVAQDLKLKIDLTPPPRERQPPKLDFGGGRPAVEPAAPWVVLPKQQAASEEEVSQLSYDLAAPEFLKRKAASDRLKSLPVDDLRKLALRIADSPSAEALVRIHSELELRYQSESFEERKNASRLLEQMAQQDRLLSADPANHSLQKHWRTRIDVAFEELKAMGAILRNGNFSMPAFIGMQNDFRPAVQILLTESWEGGDAGLEVFRRLEALSGPIQSLKGIHVYLLTGETLTEDQERQLTEIVGANRIQRRSRVALGITADRGTQGLYEGILIGGVSKGGSAAKAGLEPGDFLLAMYDTDQEIPLMKYDPASWRTFRRQIGNRLVPDPQDGNNDSDESEIAAYRLVDFDQLVERLKRYKPGAKVKLQVVKKFQAPDGIWGIQNLPRRIPQPDDPKNNDVQKVIEVEVELIGWEKLPMVN